jgi:uroporphyrin-III C-methyltransferase/precorrin-2 dehydrogenase/sirohydrochlorin ferrochelatase
MDYLPIFINIAQQPCLVVGGGQVAKRKVTLLLKAHANVTLIAPSILPELKAQVLASGGHVIEQAYHVQCLAQQRLVIAATNNQALNKQIFNDCEQANIPVNVVDAPALCRFILPSIIDRSPVVVAISSSGQSPVLARLLRTRLESMIPAAYGQLADFVGKFRQQVQHVLPDVSHRRAFWEKELQGRFADLVYNARHEAATQHLQQALSTHQQHVGEVYLVGAGPGDPDLLTFKALRLMQQADVVVYDRLVSAPILDLCRRDADMIYVGKARANHAVPQEDINQLLVRLAQEGKRVCRLKGGDPFIFGRGGEEIEQLAAAGIAFQVVPGITAASGCSAYAGIPLTHRDYAQSVRFVTGHLKDGTPNLPWSELVHERQTLVLYMGLVGLEEIAQQLIANGMRPNMPVALVSHGTRPNQQVVTGEIATIADKVQESGIKAPTLTIIGDVVKLQDKLAWFGVSE